MVFLILPSLLEGVPLQHPILELPFSLLLSIRVLSLDSIMLLKADVFPMVVVLMNPVLEPSFMGVLDSPSMELAMLPLCFDPLKVLGYDEFTETMRLAVL